MTLYCATTNKGKIREFQLAAAGAGVLVEPLPGLSEIPVCEETGTTFEENAIQKALYYGAKVDGWLFAEDSGLEVDALGGRPGVYSARFAGLGANDAANNRRLLEELRHEVNRCARYVCVIALSHSGSIVRTFRGEVEGQITREPRGEGGFGYDPLFYYGPFKCTFGEVRPEQKQSVSHRGHALKNLFEFVRFRP